MTTLAKDSARTHELGDINSHPVIASDIIYEGAYVGDNGSGYARPLSAGDVPFGFAERKVDNASGSAGDKRIRVLTKGKILLSVSGAVITDVGQPVYASDDNTFVFLPTDNSFVGKVYRWVSSGVVIVEYDIGNMPDPYGDGPRETLSVNKTLDDQDTAKTFFVDTDAVVVTVPAAASSGAITRCKVVNIAAFGVALVSVSPHTDDKIMGPDLAGANNKDVQNTKATAQRGDYVVFSQGHTDGPIIEDLKGTWAQEG